MAKGPSFFCRVRLFSLDKNQIEAVAAIVRQFAGASAARPAGDLVEFKIGDFRIGV
jgi:hypothetical protein